MRTKYLFGFVMLCITLSSCQKNELVYSCDPVVEKMILQDMPEIIQMTLTDWQKIEESEYKKAVFRALTPIQRHTFICEKIIETIRLDWTKDEKDHILKLQEFVVQNPQFLNTNWNSDIKLIDQFDLFEYKWLEEARSLGWNEKQIFAIAYSYNKILNKEGDLQIVAIPTSNGYYPTSKSGSESGGNGSWPLCFCHPSYSYCNFGQAGAWWLQCKTGICIERTPGCQLMLLGKCTGFCWNVLDGDPSWL